MTGAGTLLRNQTVVVRDGRIVSVSAAKAPAGATIIDGRGKFLMPGLSEMHAHIPGANAPAQVIEDIPRLQPRILRFCIGCRAEEQLQVRRTCACRRRPRPRARSQAGHRSSRRLRRTQLLDFRNALIKALADAGALLMLGTDSPQMFNVPGYALHHEVNVLREAGLTPWQILLSGTANVGKYTREILGKDGAFGTVAAGLNAIAARYAGTT